MIRMAVLSLFGLSAYSALVGFQCALALRVDAALAFSFSSILQLTMALFLLWETGGQGVSSAPASARTLSGAV